MLLGSTAEDVLHISAKRASASTRSWRRSSSACPAPPATRATPLRALIFDSHTTYRGVIAYVRVVDGVRHAGAAPRMALGTQVEAEELGCLRPRASPPCSRPARSATSPRALRTSRAARRRHGDDRRRAGSNADGRLSGGQADGLRRPVPGRLERLYGSARGAGEAQAQRCRALRTSPRHRRRWGLASAAGSWGCCTWRSCASGWSVNSTWTC